MKIHREGYRIILVSGIIFVLINIPAFFFFQNLYWQIHFALSLVLFGFIVQFFKHPKRIPDPDENTIVSPADGTLVSIETVEEKEYFKEEMIKLSIFMSITSVHLNRVPISGKVVYAKYHPGHYIMAFYAKSSEKNENMAYAIQSGPDKKVFLRQIAGFLARRIKPYVSENNLVTKGQELGFIRFGSRMDIYLPKSVTIKVNPREKVFGNKTILAQFND